MLLPAPAEKISAMLVDMGRQTALSFTALLPLVNPLGSALVIMGLVGEAPPEVYKRLAWRIAMSTAIFLIVIEVVGEGILRFFGLSLPVVQLAGGLVVASIGWGILNKVDASPSAEKDVNPDTNYGSLEGRAFYPFTFPVTAGPGCLVLMLTLSAHTSRRGILPDVFSHAGIALAVIILAAMVYFCYAYAQIITRRISPQTVNGFLRIMGFIVLSIGVQIAWQGLTLLLHELNHPS